MYSRILFWFILICFSCTNGPEPIQFGKDPCEYCKMTITDQKFGAEVITNKGRVYKFDAVECMIAYIQENKPELSHKLAIPYNSPTNLVLVDSLQFIISPDIKSPMGANLAAIIIQEKSPVSEAKGEQYSWNEIFSKLSK